MKIAYFLTHPIQYQSPLIRRLLTEGIDLHVYYASDSTSRAYYDPGYERSVSWDVPLLEGYPHTVFNKEPVSGSRTRQVSIYRVQIHQALRAAPADAFWLHGWNDPFVIAAWKVARELGIPIILRGETSLSSIRGGPAGRLLHRWYYQHAFREISVFLAMGTLNERLYLDYGVDPGRIFIMPHAVDNHFFQTRVASERPKRDMLRASLGLSASTIILLFCGRLAVEKDVHTLISAVGSINQGRASPVALLLAGDGPQKAALMRHADDVAHGAVHFLGFRNQTELPALYDLCDVFVLPSVFETWGLVVNEAMNAGKPVIVSSKVGAGLDLVRPGLNGEVFRAGDCADLASKLLGWLDDAPRRERGGAFSLDLINRWGMNEDAAAFWSAVRSLPPSPSAAGTKTARKPKIAFVFTHEIQYFTNVLDELHQRGRADLLGIYARHTKTMLDTGFNRVIDWDNRSTSRFPSVVLAAPADGSRPVSASTWRWNIFRTLSNYDPDIVHLNGYSAAVQWLAWLWAVMHRKTIVVRGDGDTLCGSDRSGGTRAGLFLARIFTNKARHVYYQGEENKSFWIERGANPEAMNWIPCVPDNQLYRKAELSSADEREQFRAQTGATIAETIFVVSGKLDPRKRPQDAIEALTLLHDVPCRVWFLGSGAMEPSLHHLASQLGVAEKIFWWGFRNQSELPRILQAADVLLHPSRQDPWPYSVLEGAMSGLALLLSDRTGSHPDLIGSAGAGLVFPAGDVREMARVMRMLATDPDKRTAYRAAALRASSQYTEERFCEIIESALHAPSSR